MFESALSYNGISYKKKITYKALLSAGLIALAVILPQLVHLALGAPGGVKWLPMYLPVLIGGCLLGSKWALAVGVLSPLASFAVTSVFGQPMPAAQRLAYMVAELAVFAFVSGLFTKKIAANGLWAFPAVILAQLAGRTAFLGIVAVTQSFAPLKAAMIWQQIKTGLVGLGVQALLVPVIIMGLRKLMIKDGSNE